MKSRRSGRTSISGSGEGLFNPSPACRQAGFAGAARRKNSYSFDALSVEVAVDGTTESSWAEVVGRPPVSLHVEGKPVEATGVKTRDGMVAYQYPFDLCAIGTKTVGPNTVEWRWRIENRGTVSSPRVTAFFPLYLSFGCNGRHAPVLHGSRGGLDDANFPPESWTQWNRSIVTEGLPHPGIQASSAGGRSSNRDLPFFILEDTDRKGGLFLGLGWSGDWHLHMSRETERVSIQAGMRNISLSLRAGESFRQPTVLLGRYAGSAADGQRALRAYLRDLVQPKLGGAPMRPVSFWDNYYGDRGRCYERDAMEEIPLVADAGFEYFVLDGGWNGGGQDGQFSSLLPHTGTWQIARDKFPGGSMLLKDLAAGHGIKLGVWFDIERAHRDSRAVKEHPDFFFSDWEGGGCQLLRLNDDLARDWAIEAISEQVRALDARWIRFDMNCDPAECWAKHDAEDRRGETEIRYVDNLYGLFDALRARFPDIVVENCASGGRRIDLETIRRTHTDWISDHTQSEAVIRYHLHGACRWLPCNHINTSMAHAYLEPNRPVNWRGPLPACAYLSHFGGNFSVSDRLKPLTEAARATLRQYVGLFAGTAACFAGEVRAIGDQQDTKEGPTGLLAVDPTAGRRAVVLFGVAPSAAASFVPKDFQALVAEGPAIGDEGTDQFTSAYLWYS